MSSNRIGTYSSVFFRDLVAIKRLCMT